MAVERLAREVGADEGALLRLMRTLAAVGVFAQPAPREFALNRLSDCLRSDVPGSLRDFVRLRGGQMYWKAWAELPHAVATGEAAFARAHGMPHFTYLEHHPGDARLFDEGLQALTSQMHEAVLSICDFSRFCCLADVGGGAGGFLAAILRRTPRLRGMLLERPAVAEHARAALSASDVEDRIQIVGGDFFAAVPCGSDAILLSRVLHNWSDAECLRILANCRSALPDGGRLLVVEYVVTDGPEGRAAKLFDLQMLVYMGAGRERTEEEFASLLGQAKFEPRAPATTAMGISVIEAIAA